MDVPAISIVICTYNRAEQFRATLRTLLDLETPPGLSWEVVLVDNNSRDHTRDVAAWFTTQCRHAVRYVFEARQGKSYALNTGIDASRAAIVAFTDDDVLVRPGWLVALWREFQDPRCTGVGGRVEPLWTKPRPPWLAKSGPCRLMYTVVEYDCGPEPCTIGSDRAPIGANVAYRRASFERYGPFRTDLGDASLLLGQDTEYGRRLLKNGELLRYAPDAVVVHPVEPYRLHKSYFRKWYYDYGRSLVRLSPPLADAVRYFGVPRYLLRELATALGSWLTARGQERRFYHEVACCRVLGTIAETWRTRTTGPIGASRPQ